VAEPPATNTTDPDFIRGIQQIDAVASIFLRQRNLLLKISNAYFRYNNLYQQFELFNQFLKTLA